METAYYALYVPAQARLTYVDGIVPIYWDANVPQFITLASHNIYC